MTHTTQSTCDNSPESVSFTCGLNSSTMSASPTLTQLFTQQTVNTATFSNSPKNNLGSTIPTTNTKIYFTRTAPPAATGAPSCGGASYYPANGATNQCLNSTLSWNAGDQNPTGYDVYFGTSFANVSTCNVAAKLASNQPGVYFDPGALATNTTYYWKIISKNGSGDLPCGSATTYAFTTGSGDVPPTSLNSSAGNIFCVGTSSTISNVGGSTSEGSNFIWQDGGCKGLFYILTTFQCSGTNDGGYTYNSAGTFQTDVYVAGCNANTSCTALTVTVVANNNSTPTGLTPNPATPCVGTIITLTASGGTCTGCTYEWRTTSCATAPFATTTVPTVTVTITGNTTYYVDRTGGTALPTGCPNTTGCKSLAVVTAAAPASSAANIVGCTGTTPFAMTGATATPAGSVTSATWAGGTGLGSWTQNANPAIATFTPSQPYGSFTATLTVTYNCGAAPIVSTCLVTWADGTVAYKTWYGVTSNDWFTASNWCNGVPTSTIDAFIPPGMPNEPVTIGGVGAVCKTLTVSATASVTTTGSNNLDVYGDWNCNGTYTYNTGKITFRGSGQNINTANTFYNLTINQSGGVTLNQPITVNNILTLTSGNILTSSTNLLTLASGSSVSPTGGSAASYVIGPMRKNGIANGSSFDFPVGSGNVLPFLYWARIGVYNIASGPADFQAQYFRNAYSNTTSLVAPLNNVSIIEYWQLDRMSAGGSANVRLYWEDNTSSGITDCSLNGDLVVAHWNNPVANSWNDNGSPSVIGTCTGTAPTAGWIQSSSQSTFSPFTFGSKSGGVNPLPVELLFFNAKCLDTKVTADWSTASEKNNDFFTLERSADGSNFNFVKNINGAGNSSSVKNYSATDVDVLAGTSYYRITQTDFDGKTEAFNPVAVHCPDDIEFAVNVTPSPSVDGNIFVSISGTPNENVLLVLHDVMGNEVYTKALINETGTVTLSIDMREKLSAGVYFVIASSNDKYISKKIIVR